MKNINLKFFLLIAYLFCTFIVNGQNQWFTLVSGNYTVSACNTVYVASANLSSPISGVAGSCQNCGASSITQSFSGTYLGSMKLASFYMNVSGAADYQTCNPIGSGYTGYYLNNILVTSSGGYQSNDFSRPCGGTCQISANISGVTFRCYYQFAISNVSYYNSDKDAMVVTIPGIDTISAGNRATLRFDVALATTENWYPVSFSNFTSIGSNQGTLLYNAVIGTHTEWVGQELKIRLVQPLASNYTTPYKLFKFYEGLLISTSQTPDCPSTLTGDGKLTVNLENGCTKKDANGVSYYPLCVTLYNYSDGCNSSCPHPCSGNYCRNYVIKQEPTKGDGGFDPNESTDAQYISPTYTLSGIPAGTYLLEVYNGRFRYPAMKVITIESNNLSGVVSLNVVKNYNGTDYHLSSCNTSGAATAAFNATGGSSPYMYSVDGGAYSSNTTASLLQGSHNVKFLDNYGCTFDGTPVINAPTALSFSGANKTSDVLCSGGSTGAIQCATSGGLPNYYYTISRNGSSYTGFTVDNNIIGNLIEGTYSLSINDGTSCTKSAPATVVITQPGPLVFNATPNMPRCYGESTGSITFRPSGGHPNYTITIKTSEKTFDLLLNKSSGVQFNSTSSLPAQTYTVTIQDANLCSKDTTITISNPSQVTINNLLPTRGASCLAAPNGEATFTISNLKGSNPQFLNILGNPVANISLISGTSYLWTHLGIGASPQIKVVDGFCSSPFTSVTINPKSPAISITPQGSFADCPDKPNGSISVTVNNGEPASIGYTYTIKEKDDIVETSTTTMNNPQLIPAIDGSKIYSVKVTDGLGCFTDFQDISVGFDPNRLQLNNLALDNAKCENNPTGKITASRKTGTGYNPISYTLLGESQTGEGDNNSFTFNNLLPNKTYTVQVTDSKCTVKISAPLLANPNPVSIIFSDIKNQSCKEIPNGAFRITASSIGPGNVDYGIDSIYNRTLFTKANANTIYYSGKDSLHYEFKVVDTNKCFAEASFDLINLRNNPHSIVLGYDSVACQNDHTGVIRLGVKQKSRQPAYSFYRNGSLNAADSTFSNLASQLDNIRIVDKEGCPGDTVLKVPVIASSVKFSPEPVATDASCAKASNGNITATATNGIPFTGGLYKYKISSGDSITAKTATFKKLKANTDFVITAIDAKNCIRSSSVIPIRVINDSLKLSIPISTNATCTEKATGSVLVTRVNGEPFKTGFIFNVKDSVGQLQQTKNQPGTETTINLKGFAKGRYVVSVSDSNSCSVSQPFKIGYNALFSTNGSIVSRVRRFGKPEGIVRSVVNDGNGRFVYQLYKNDDLVTPVRKDTVKNNILQIGQLYAGNYLLKIKDTANCKYDNDEWFEDDIFIQQPEKALAVSVASQTNVYCYGESTASVKLQGVGGYRTYAYSINDTNAFHKDSTFMGLKSGVYKLYLRDSEHVDTSIYVTITQPSKALSPLNSSVTLTKCYGFSDGSAIVSAQGGTPPYRVSIDSTHWFSNGEIKNLSAGVYRVIVRDTLNCSTYLTNVIVKQPDPVSVKKYAITNTPCLKSEGNISVTDIKGGNGNYSYSWTNKEKASLGTLTSISNLRSGPYKLSLVDGLGCLGDTTFFVSDLSDIWVNFTTTPVNCWGKANGKAEMTVIKGAQPFREVQWPGIPTSFYATTALDSGLHRVVMLDNLGCQKDTVFRITSLSEIQVPERWITDPLCLGNNNGEIRVNASGGRGGYHYNWGNFGLGNNIDNLASGTYWVTVTDANNCEKEFDINLAYTKVEKPNLGKDMQVCSKSDYILSPPGYVKYDWKLNNNSISAEPFVVVKEPGDYIVNVESNEGCIGSDTVNITYSADTMLADFLLTTKAFAGDTIMLIEISRPLPDSVSWFLASGAKLIDYGRYYKQIALADTGTYEFVMIAYYNGCADMVKKYVEVVYADGKSNQKSAKVDLIQSVSLFPNPNNGQFSVDVMLSHKADVIMRLINLGTGTTESMRVVKGSDMYTERFSNRLSPGMYTLYIQAGNESRTVNIVVI